ncbi:hypothetical protein FOZ60_010989 [Perkinsus olseni]|uniref:Uncharacterized protein n=1 Tax=Perkinsus olseni TaxID=32597 RepID=A0A7J6NEC4_PEROL|nr:hypothetical protein FOZ60_010989 [Perkinsus olseni]
MNSSDLRPEENSGRRASKRAACVMPGCDKLARKASSEEAPRYCISHGGGRRCMVTGCRASARSRRGFCYRHRHRGGNSPSVDQQSAVLRRSTPGYSSANTNYTVPLTEPLIKIESLLSRIIEQLVREVVDGSAQDENANGLHAQGNMNAAFILKNHSSLRREIGQLPGGSQACRDLNDLVYLLQISFTGDYGYLLFELVRRRSCGAPWAHSGLAHEVTVLVKRHVYSCGEHGIRFVIAQPIKWGNILRILRQERSGGGANTARTVIVVWSRKSVTLMKKLVRMGANATLHELSLAFLHHMGRHGFFEPTVRYDMPDIGQCLTRVHFWDRCQPDPSVF